MKSKLLILLPVLVSFQLYGNVKPDSASSYCGRTYDPLGAIRGDWSGLAYSAHDPAPVKIDGSFVTSCIRYDFRNSVIRGLSITYRHTKKRIKGDGCVTGFCGTNPGIIVFSRKRRNSWTRVSFPNPPVAEQYVQWPVKLNRGADSVLICRGGGGHGRNNIQVRSVFGF